MSQIKKTKQFQNIIDYILGLDRLGNAPYFSGALVDSLVRLFKSENLEYSEDEHALYLKIGNQKLPPVLVDTHLDHPGFVISEDNTVHSLGSFLNSKMINKIVFPDKLPVGFYTSFGYYITSGYLYKITTVNNQIKAYYQTDNNLTLPVNTQVMPIFSTGLKKDILSLRSADNLATVLVCLSLIEKLKKKKNLNVTFVFTKLEEIYQLSATGIARHSSTPFEKIESNTPIIVLEVAPVLTNFEAQNGDLAVATKENIFNTLNLGSKTLSHLEQICQDKKINLHFSTLNSHGNSISYRLVAGNCETICLHIGSFNRHNVNTDGDFTAEFVYLKSLANLEKVTAATIEKLSQEYPDPIRSLTLLPNEEKKRRQLLATYTRAYPRLKLGKLYPRTLLEYVYFAYYSLLSRFYEPR